MATLSRRIHVTGASGSGATTLGRALATHFGIPHHDTDDYYWRPTDPPYTVKRPVPERERLMREMFLDLPQWVLSGSMDSWGAAIWARFDAVIFLSAPADLRARRIAEREAARFGVAAVAPGGARAAELAAFLAWSDGYDAGDRPGRSRARHEAWLARLACPVIRLDGALGADALAGAAVEALDGIRGQPPIQPPPSSRPPSGA